MNKLIILLFICLGVSQVSGQKSFFKQNESAQHYLGKQGDSFRIFQYNTICNNWQLAEYNGDYKNGKIKSLRIMDDDTSRGVRFRSHNPIAVQPYTEYTVEYKYLILDAGSRDTVSVDIEMFDENRDYFATEEFELPVIGASDDWQAESITFQTPYRCHAVMLQIKSGIKETADVVFDEIYLTQTSGAMAFRPEGRVLIEPNDVHKARPQTVKLDLGVEEQEIEFSLLFSWNGKISEQAVTVAWLDSKGRVIATDTCAFGEISGVLPQWNGVSSNWTRAYGDSADKVSVKKDIHYGDSAGTGKIERTLVVPDNATAMEFDFDGDFEAGLTLDALTVVAYTRG